MITGSGVETMISASVMKGLKWIWPEIQKNENIIFWVYKFF